MKIFTDSKEINSFIAEQKKQGYSFGFVPTMGALHAGHISLLEQAKKENDKVICSIFVNPLQFNRKEDLDNYPDRFEEDKKMLEQHGCDVLFYPETSDMYPEKPAMDYDLGLLDTVMEGEHRPGHFKGVVAVISRFFEILEPNKAYFGEKDFQQLAVIRWLVEHEKSEVTIVGCSTVRFENGLAMSSRNYLLSEADKEVAAQIYRTLQYAKEQKGKVAPKDLMGECLKQLENDFDTEYFEIVDERTFESIENWSESTSPRAFVAAYLSGVRLIDNLSLIN
jgi:pantoate--beta-alanine ligase